LFARCCFDGFVFVLGVTVFKGVSVGVVTAAGVVFGVVMSSVGFGLGALLWSQLFVFANRFFVRRFFGDRGLIRELDFFGFFGRFFRRLFLFLFGFLFVENRSADDGIGFRLGLRLFLLSLNETRGKRGDILFTEGIFHANALSLACFSGFLNRRGGTFNHGAGCFRGFRYQRFGFRAGFG
jgi:hypothetical protein